jgi:hypothetical protein
MLPEIDTNLTIITKSQPSKTFKLNISKNKVVGTVDEIEALKQTIFLMLSVERFENLIYSWNYGVQTNDLIGEDYSYVCSELKSRISAALVYDDRINSVDSFSFSKNKENLIVSFVVNTIYGDINASKEVDI